MTFLVGVAVGLLLAMIVGGEPPDGEAECFTCGEDLWDEDGDQEETERTWISLPPGAQQDNYHANSDSRTSVGSTGGGDS